MTNPITRYLTKTGMTQRAFAAEVGVRDATVSAWKKGSVPRPEQMARIAVVTGGEIPVTAWFDARPLGDRASDQQAGAA